jgi:ribose 5-phosphate isomerase RpiB
MRIGIATDHGGFVLNAGLVAHLREARHEVVDVGPITSTRRTTIPTLSFHSRGTWLAAR